VSETESSRDEARGSWLCCVVEAEQHRTAQQA
jgi:hypothetical protein